MIINIPRIWIVLGNSCNVKDAIKTVNNGLKEERGDKSEISPSLIALKEDIAAIRSRMLKINTSTKRKEPKKGILK